MEEAEHLQRETRITAARIALVKALGDHAAGIASDSTLEEALADHANAHDHADYGDHEEATGA